MLSVADNFQGDRFSLVSYYNNDHTLESRYIDPMQAHTQGGGSKRNF